MSFQFSKLNLYQRQHEITQTGQQTSYADFDDGYFKKGWKTDASRFAVNGSVVFDRATGLMWSQSLTVGGRRTWAAALAYADSATLGGYTDWRLPNIKELMSIFDLSLPDGGGVPYCFYLVFAQREGEEYWTSTTYAGSTTNAYEFNGPTIITKNKTDADPFVCLVRGGV